MTGRTYGVNPGDRLERGEGRSAVRTNGDRAAPALLRHLATRALSRAEAALTIGNAADLHAAAQGIRTVLQGSDAPALQSMPEREQGWPLHAIDMGGTEDLNRSLHTALLEAQGRIEQRIHTQRMPAAAE